jgi:uncharacterized protein YdeI (BOF family)
VLNKKVLISFLVAGIVLAFVGCAQASYIPGTNPGTANAAGNSSVAGNPATSETGTPQIPDEEAPTIIEIGDILAGAGNYKDQEVIVEGKIVSECGSGCWFTLNDRTGTIYVDLKPNNLVIPQKRGATAKVYGKVVIENGDAFIIGSKVEF